MIAGSWIIKDASSYEQLPNMARNVLKCGKKPLFYQNSMKRVKCISSNICRQNVSVSVVGLFIFCLILCMYLFLHISISKSEKKPK